MQDNAGFNRLLTLPAVYEFVQNVVGARHAGRWLMENFWRLKGGQTVVDVGCGPGLLLNALPANVRYFGFDISELYIRAARKRFGQRGTFLVGTAHDFLVTNNLGVSDADLIVCNGLLHHLGDGEAIEVLQLSKKLMGPTGRLVCVEPTYLAHQTWISRWLISKDRGRNVRQEYQWKHLVHEVFDSFSTHVVTGLIWIPYVHIIIECTKEPVTRR